ncbi:thioesterase family protein [Nemorincola caseinilytica]|uniref:Thioesterase family protein n=1 Tax=Nemorincola caseinilytica TaxID=2054315 RepID=A0ABP8NC00_9BACT
MHHFPVKLPLRIDWSEMDLFGHVNNVAYFKYIQASRVNYWELTGVAASFATTRIGPILLSTGCQFIKPLHYPGNIVVEVRMEFMKTTSFGLHHRVLSEAGEVAAEAHDVIVTYDFNKMEKTTFQPEFRSAVERIEGRTF